MREKEYMTMEDANNKPMGVFLVVLLSGIDIAAKIYGLRAGKY